jgi:hypothetical protein
LTRTAIKAGKQKRQLVIGYKTIISQNRLRRTKKRGSCRALKPIPPKKTFGLRSAQPKKKPPIRATILKKVYSWRTSTTRLEPILWQKVENLKRERQPRRLFQQSCNAPRQKTALWIF